MNSKCYNCGIDLDGANKTVEHIPAQNLFDGFPNEFKANRLTVPCCRNCNNEFSKIDQEIRDFIGIGNNDMNTENIVTQKAVRSIMRKSNWKDRAFINNNGDVESLTFSYEDLWKLHVKNFKGIFYEKFKTPLPQNYKIEIIANGDENLSVQANAFYHLMTLPPSEWKKSGHEDVFKYIISGVKADIAEDSFEKVSHFSDATFLVAVMIYHNVMPVIVVTSTIEYLDANKAAYGY